MNDSYATFQTFRIRMENFAYLMMLNWNANSTLWFTTAKRVKQQKRLRQLLVRKLCPIMEVEIVLKSWKVRTSKSFFYLDSCCLTLYRPTTSISAVSESDADAGNRYRFYFSMTYPLAYTRKSHLSFDITSEHLSD